MQLTEQGVKPSQIAILVRTNRTIKDLAEFLMNNGCPYPLVSDEAFRLDASQAVNALVTALRVLIHPDDPISRATLQKFALTFLGSDEIVKKIEEQRDILLQKPIFDLVENLFVELQLDTIEEMKSQSAYICAFYDQMAAYLQDNCCDIDSFIKEWDNTLHEKAYIAMRSMAYASSRYTRVRVWSLIMLSFLSATGCWRHPKVLCGVRQPRLLSTKYHWFLSISSPNR